MICYDLKTLQKAYCSGESCRFLFLQFFRKERLS